MQIYAATGSTTTDPEPTETYTVSFSVPSGVSAIDPITVEPDEAFTLPTAGAPSGYTFVGWTTSAVSSTTTAPTSYAGGISVTTSGSLTLYALYTYTRTTAGNGGYELVTSAPSDWTGDYVITCGTGSDLYAMKGLSGNTKYESASCGGAVALSSTGMTLSGTTLTNVSSAYVFVRLLLHLQEQVHRHLSGQLPQLPLQPHLTEHQLLQMDHVDERHRCEHVQQRQQQLSVHGLLELQLLHDVLLLQHHDQPVEVRRQRLDHHDLLHHPVIGRQTKA